MATLEGLDVTVTLVITGFFEDETKVLPVDVSTTVGAGNELITDIEARILSDTDGDGDTEPVQGPNGLLTGTVTLDISGNEIFASYSGQAQPAGFQIIIEGLRPEGVAPGTIEDQGGMSGVNTINTPTYDGTTGTLTLDWTFLGFQPGTSVNQTVFYDNLLEDAPIAGDDGFAVDDNGSVTGNVLANDTDLDNSGSIGTVDITTVTAVDGQAASVGQYVDVAGGGRVRVNADGSMTFDPDGDFNDLAIGATRDVSFDYTASDTADLSDVGTVTITVTGTNASPTVNDGALFALTGTNEDTSSSSATVAEILTSAGYADSDPAPSSGVAVTGLSGNGTWQYSTDGTTWTGFGSVSSSFALLLSSTTQVRYDPDGQNGETATFTYRAWDQTSGSASTNATRSTADVTTNGGSSAFSTATASTSIAVTDVSEAPVLDAGASPTLTGINEDSGAPVGGSTAGSTLVSALLGGASDPDTAALNGIAVVGASAGGTLWFSTNGGTAWTQAPSVSETTALLFHSDARLYFQPAANANGTISDALTFRAWDRTTGTNGSTADTTANGGGTAFSVATDTASITISAVNDAPTLTASGSIAANEDVATALSGISFADIDAGSGSVTVTLSVPSGALAATSGSGVTVGGTANALTLTGTTADINAYIAASNVTFTTAQDAVADVTLTVIVSDDGKTGSGGAQQDFTTVTLGVTAVNDAPVVVSSSGTTGYTENDAGVVVDGDLTLSDVDDTTLSSAAVSIAGNFQSGQDALAFTNDGSTMGDIAAIWDDATGVLTLASAGGTATVAEWQAALRSVTYTNSSESPNTVNRTISFVLNDGAAASSAASKTMIITAANDAPFLSALPDTNVTTGRTSALPDFTVSDIDGDILAVTLAATNGTIDGLTDADPATAGIQLTGNAAEINAAVAAATFTAAANGAASIAISLTDGVIDAPVTGTLNLTASTPPTDNPGEPDDDVPSIPGGATIIDAEPSQDGSPVTVVGNPDTVDEVQIAGDVILGDNLDNAYLVGEGDYTVEGNELDNVIYGNVGDSTIIASGGNDTIDGGWGFNSVVFSGSSSDYSIEIVDGVAEVTNLLTGDVSRLANVQELTFSDGTQPLFATSQIVLSGLYETFLGRGLDGDGFDFWMEKSADGADPDSIAKGFLNSPEFAERTEDLTSEEFVSSLFNDFLDRDIDQAGFDFWVDAINDGLGYGDVALEFVLAQEIGTRLDELMDRGEWLTGA